MCGRYALIASAPRLARLLGLIDLPELTPRYNIAPSQSVTAVRGARQGGRELVQLRWGLLPGWSKTPAKAYRMINAKAETLTQRPAFRTAYRRRRCLVPADGFYEWKQLADRRQPYFIAMEDGAPFVFAGLWERWRGPDEQLVESCAIITTEPNELIADIHTRMPAILGEQDFDAWLNPDEQDTSRLDALLRPYRADAMTATAVSSHVNNPRNDDPRCIEPLTGESSP